MFRYADPEACPGCRAPLVPGATHCPACDLVLTGPLAQRLFATLGHADSLLAQMRVTMPAMASTAPSVETETAPPAAGKTAPSDRSYPAYPGRPTPARGGLSAASVPKILLGLGATCLLVAALVFLAVAWSALGVGGRTGVLVLLTGGALAAAYALASRDLRAGAESFATVALGLLVLDLAGADEAGWLGDPTTATLFVVVGVTLAAASFALSVAARQLPVGALLSGEIIGAVGVLVAGAGCVLSDWHSDEVPVIVALALAAGAAYVARQGGLRVASWACAGVAGLWWLVLTGLGIGRVAADPEIAEVWLGFEVWPLLVAIALTAAVAFAPLVEPPLAEAARVVAGSAAVALGTFAVTVVAFDESVTVRSLAELAVVAAAVAVGSRLALPARWVVVTPSCVAGLALSLSGAALVAEALEALLGFEPWDEQLTAAVDVPDLTWSWPLLVPAAALGALAPAWLAVGCLVEVPARRVLALAGPLTFVTVALVPVLYGVPLWVALVVLVVLAFAGLGTASYATGLEPLAASLVLGLLALVASFANPWSTAVALGLVTAAAGVAAFRESKLPSMVGGVVLPVAGTGFVWTCEHLADVDLAWRAVPVILLFGAFTILRPGLERELPAYVAAVIAAAASVIGPDSVDQTWLAAYLTLGGVVVTVSALVHEDRRELAWGGLGLFTLAQWVRLQQLGVDTVEAYTLPLAVVLLVVGLVRMRISDLSSQRALGAGLGLALVPTLLQVLLDPVSLRALALGLGCLVAVAAGVGLRWTAPLVAGAAVGTVLVLREATHAQLLQQWMVIGLVGVVLTLVGVTWEHRLAELRAVAAYVRGLR
jgi:hypothetical protein